MGETYEFKVKYSGPAVEDHRMDVNYLGTALTGLGGMFNELDELVYKNSNEGSQVKVKETRPGSFELVLEFVQPALDYFVNLLSSKQATAAANFLQFTSPVLAILVGSCRSVKDKKTEELAAEDEPIANADDKLAEELFSRQINRLKINRDFQINFAGLAKPVTMEGIESVDISDRDGQIVLTINEDQARELQRLREKLESKPETWYEEAMVEIVAPQLDRPLELKWKLKSECGEVFGAYLKDIDFAGKVENGEVVFKKGQKFQVYMEIKESYLGANEYKREYEILKIRV